MDDERCPLSLAMQCDPMLDWSGKYSPDQSCPLSRRDVASCGRQILEV